MIELLCNIVFMCYVYMLEDSDMKTKAHPLSIQSVKHEAIIKDNLITCELTPVEAPPTPALYAFSVGFYVINRHKNFHICEVK